MNTMYLDNLLLIMSASGSIAFLVYLAAKQIWKTKLTPTHRYWLLHLVLGFFLLPIPLLANDIRDLIRKLLRNDTLFLLQYEDNLFTQYNLYKSIYITEGDLSLPASNYVLLTVVIVWIILFCICLLYYTYHFRMAKQLMDEYPQEYPDVCVLLDDSYRKLIRRRHICIRIAPQYHLSFTHGTWRPTIVLAEAECKEHQKYILMHELTHVKYFDSLFLGCSLAALAVHFFNPLVYFLFQEVKLCNELHCDEKIVQSLKGDEWKAYGHLIIDNSQKPPFFDYVTPFADNNYKIIKERVVMIKTNTRKRIFAFLLSAVVLIPASIVPALAYSVPNVYINNSFSDTVEGSDWAQFNGTENSAFAEEYEKYFSETDAFFIDEDGTVIFADNDTAVPYSCNHTYVSSTLSIHKKNGSGGCTVSKYSCKRCTKCSRITNQKLISTTTYVKCPH